MRGAEWDRAWSRCARVAAFRFAGRTGAADNIEIARRLLEGYRIFAARRTGPARGACVRITPTLFNSAADVDILTGALKKLLRAQA